MKFFVIAGNHEQARRWIRQECDRRWASGDTAVTLSDYIYVDDVAESKVTLILMESLLVLGKSVGTFERS